MDGTHIIIPQGNKNIIIYREGRIVSYIDNLSNLQLIKLKNLLESILYLLKKNLKQNMVVVFLKILMKYGRFLLMELSLNKVMVLV